VRAVTEVITLERPLVILDVETHAKGTPEQTRIVEVSFQMYFHDGRPVKSYSTLINPGCAIHPGATEVHHITDEMVKDAPTWDHVAANLASGWVDCDYCGYNVNFDLRAVNAEMQRSKVAWSYDGARLADPLKIWQVRQPRKLKNAVEEFCARAQVDAHRASGDVQDAHDVLVGQLTKWADLPRTVRGLHDLCFESRLEPGDKLVWDGQDAVFNFGKHRGRTLQAVATDDRGYLTWLVNQDFISKEAEKILRKALGGEFVKKG
jgi:DNA polymerase-3 subunit epsilon